MELVTVKTKFQIVIPQSIREQAHVDVGDLLEASVEDGKITFTPKSVIDRLIDERLMDLAAGRTHGPYDTADEAIAAVERRISRRPQKMKKRT